MTLIACSTWQQVNCSKIARFTTVHSSLGLLRLYNNRPSLEIAKLLLLLREAVELDKALSRNAPASLQLLSANF
jgi:hypothetical protein